MKKFALILLLAGLAASCDKPNNSTDNPLPVEGSSDITYQILVYSFADSNGDQIGDFRGIISKLDYLKDMGVGAIWLSPIHKSSSYHGYDVIDYESINPLFGTEADFVALLEAAHSKEIKIYLDYVINHSAKEHEWFKEARKSPDSPYRDYYIFSDNPQSDISNGRIAMIAQEGASGYDPGQWFSTGTGTTKYHSHFWTDWFADLNYGPVATCEKSPAFIAVANAADKWIKMGVDGFRLDAVKHIYHSETSFENPEFLRKFYNRCNETYKVFNKGENIYMVGEVLSAADRVAPYYRGLPTLFEFSFWWTLRDAINSGSGYWFGKNISDYRSQYNQVRRDANAAIKLSNHDENRTGSELGRSTAKEKLAACVLLTSEGDPYIYQGEELGYFGVKNNGDEYVRTPILWNENSRSAAIAGVNHKYDRNLLVKEYSVEHQANDINSVLSTYQKFGKLRTEYPALNSGTMIEHKTYNPNNSKDRAVAAWYMSYKTQNILVLHNFSGTEISLSLAEDKLDNLIGSNGAVQQTGSSGVKLGAYSTALYLQ